MINDHIRGIACICGGILIHFSLGTIYTFGNMSPYVASYIKLRTADTWVTPGHMVWIFSMAVFSQGFTMALGGVLAKKIGTRLTCLIGCWTMSLSTILTFFSIKQNVWAVIVTYGFFFGMGTGLTYSVSLSAPMKWFPMKKGLVTGTVVAGYGLGSLLFNIVQTRFINPSNISPNSTNIGENATYTKISYDKYFYDNDVLDRVPLCFLIIGGSYASIQLLGVILLTDYDSRITTTDIALHVASSENGTSAEETLVGEGKKKDGSRFNNGTPDSARDGVIEDIGTNYSVREAVRMRKFWILSSTFFMNGIVIVTISSLYKAFGQRFISDDRYFSIVGAVAAIFNSGGRLVWGRLLDRFSYRVMMSSLTITMAVVMSTFYLCSLVPPGLGAKVMYGVWVCLLFFSLAGNFAMFPAATAQTFGSKNMAIIYGVVFAGYAVSSILGAVLCSMLLKIISYGGQFSIATLSALISLCLTQFFGPSPSNIIKKKEALE